MGAFSSTPNLSQKRALEAKNALLYTSLLRSSLTTHSRFYALKDEQSGSTVLKENIPSILLSLRRLGDVELNFEWSKGSVQISCASGDRMLVEGLLGDKEWTLKVKGIAVERDELGWRLRKCLPAVPAEAWSAEENIFFVDKEVWVNQFLEKVE